MKHGVMKSQDEDAQAILIVSLEELEFLVFAVGGFTIGAEDGTVSLGPYTSLQASLRAMRLEAPPHGC